MATDTTARVKGPLVETRKLVTLRIPIAQLTELKRRAAKHRLTFTEYMIRAGLGELEESNVLVARVDDLESRFERLERLQDLGGFG